MNNQERAATIARVKMILAQEDLDKERRDWRSDVRSERFSDSYPVLFNFGIVIGVSITYILILNAL